MTSVNKIICFFQIPTQFFLESTKNH